MSIINRALRWLRRDKAVASDRAAVQMTVSPVAKTVHPSDGRLALRTGRTVTRHGLRCIELMGGRTVMMLARRADRVAWSKWGGIYNV